MFLTPRASGADARGFDDSIEGNGIRDSQGAMDLIGRVRFSGLTPLGTAMEQKIINPLVVRPAKAGRLPVRLRLFRPRTPCPSADDRSTSYRNPSS